MTTDPQLEGLRPSDAERTQALDLLSSHYVEGRLDLAEFDERSGQVTAARTFGDIAPAFQGLPGGMPFVLGADGRPVARGAGLPAEADADADRELTAVKKKGSVVEAVDGIGLAVALVSFFVLMFLNVPYFWAVWPAYGLLAVVVRIVMDMGDDEEKAYESIKKAEAEQRSERLKIAMQRRRELEGPQD